MAFSNQDRTSDTNPLPVNVISGGGTLPTGAATSANQTSELTKLDTLHTDLVAATPAGANLIGKVGIDQTTPGTTNAVVAGGNVASGAADGGSFPLKMGGYAGGTIPTTVTTGQRVNLWLGVNGQMVMGGTAFTGANGSSNALVQATITSGNSGHLTVAPFVSNGTTWDMATKPNLTSRIASAAATTNATNAKASAGSIHNVTAYNATGAVKYLKIYNKASAPTVGTDTPIFTFAIPPNGTLSHSFPNGGYYASTGIAYALTGAAADADTTALVAADVVGVNIAYS